jgi:protein-S-isoprenylcysteine O-methyltransferase Ste14
MIKKPKILMLSAITKFVAGIILFGAFLFICGGGFRYWNAWIYITTFAICIFFFGVYLYITDKELLEKRINTKEKGNAQKAYTFSAGFSFLATFFTCGLDYRFGWSNIPLVVVIIALIIMLAGYALFIITLMYNRFASRVIEIQNGQKVIDTGVYSIVRHPLYSAAVIMFFASPVVLGSWWAVIPMLIFLVGIILRILNEEKVLLNGLEGYADYMKKVKFRLVPFIW